MPEAAPVLLHVGYHKTGTTFLQTGLFRDPATGFSAPWTSAEIRRTLVAPTDFEFDPTRACEAFAPGLERAAPQGRVAVVSDERLSGSPHAGGYDTATLARRLAATFPRARVLVGIREQRQTVLSLWKQYVRDGGGASLRGYLQPRRPYEVPQFRFSHLEYHHSVSLYQELFGPDRVLVLPFEELASNPSGSHDRIAAFAGLPPIKSGPMGERYPSLGALTLSLKRPFNRVFVRTSLSPAAPLYLKDHERRFERLDRWLPRAPSRLLERRLRAYVATVVGERYAESNRVTATLAGLDLTALGYPQEGADG